MSISRTAYPLQISIVCPLYNEDESLTELNGWVEKVMRDNSLTYEFILIDDGSTDRSWDVICTLTRSNPNIKGIRFRKNYGKSAALNVGFAHCRGEVVVTMDADLQDSPDEIPALREKIINGQYDLVSGWKKKRHDPLSKTIPTKLFNWVTRRMSGIQLHDFNCGLKAYHNEVVKNIEVYGEMHRYIPVIAKSNGFNKIGEQIVAHRARKFGVSKFGINRFVNGFLDLLTIYFMGKFGKKPMHFFGLYGILAFVLGFLIALGLGLDKLFHIIRNEQARLITDSPYYYLGLAFMIIGSQLFLAGFIGELISRNHGERNYYSIAETVNVSNAE